MTHAVASYHVRPHLLDEAGPGEDGDIYEFLIVDSYGNEIARSYNNEIAELITHLLNSHNAKPQHVRR